MIGDDNMKKTNTYKRIIFISILFLLIPVLIVGIIDFTVISRNSKINIKQQIQYEANKQSVYINQLYTDVLSLQYMCKSSKIYSNYYRNDSQNTIQMITDLGNKMLSFSNFDGIYYYNCLDGKICSSYANYNKEFFFSEKYKLTDNYDQFINKENQCVFLRAERSKTDKYSTLIFVPLPYYDVNNVLIDSYLIIVIDDENILKHMGTYQIGEGSKWIIGTDDNIILTSSASDNLQLAGENRYISDIDISDSYTYHQVLNNTKINLLWIMPYRIINVNTFKLALLQGLFIFVILGIGIVLLYRFSKKLYRPIKDLVCTVSAYNGVGNIHDDFDYLCFSINDLIQDNNTMDSFSKGTSKEKALYQLLSQPVKKDDKTYNYLLNQELRVDRHYFKIIILDDVIDNQDVYEFLVSEISEILDGTNVDILYTARNRHICFIATDLSPDKVDVCVNQKIRDGRYCLVGKWVDNVSDIRSSFIDMTVESGVEEKKVNSIIEIHKSESEYGKNYKKKNINNILLYIEENYCSPNFSLKCMSIDFKTTSSNLSHFFRKNTGQNISTYIELKKLEKAKQLIELQEYKVNEIALLVGYSGVGSLIDLFKKYEGTTPSGYMERKMKI